MAQFHEHPDGWIYVRTAAGTYADTTANFIADFRWQIPARPEGLVERLYDDGGRHVLTDAKGNHVLNGPVPWEWGDRAIAQVETLLSRQSARLGLVAEAEAAERAAFVAAVAAAAEASVQASVQASMTPAPARASPSPANPVKTQTF